MSGDFAGSRPDGSAAHLIVPVPTSSARSPRPRSPRRGPASTRSSGGDPDALATLDRVRRGDGRAGQRHRPDRAHRAGPSGPARCATRPTRRGRRWSRCARTSRSTGSSTTCCPGSTSPVADAATRHYVERTLRDFRRAGVDRDEATRARVRELCEELVAIGQEFARNIRADTRTARCDRPRWTGLPEDFVRATRPATDGKVRITTDYPDYVPFMTYAGRRGSARGSCGGCSTAAAYPVQCGGAAAHAGAAPRAGHAAGLPELGRVRRRGQDDRHRREHRRRSSTASREPRPGPGRPRLRDAAGAQAGRRPGRGRGVPWDAAYLEDRVKAERLAFDTQAMRPYFEYGRVKAGVHGRRRAALRRALRAAARRAGVARGRRVLRRARRRPPARPHLPGHAPAAGQVQPRRDVRHVDRQGGAPRARVRAAVQLAAAGRRAGAAAARRRAHVLPRVRPPASTTSSPGTAGGRARAASRTEWDFVEAPVAAARGVGPRRRDAGRRSPSTTRPASRSRPRWWRSCARPRSSARACSCAGRCSTPRSASSSTGATRPGSTRSTSSARRASGTRRTGTSTAPSCTLAFGHLDGYSALYCTYMWSLVIAKDLFTAFARDGLLVDRDRRPVPRRGAGAGRIGPGGRAGRAVPRPAVRFRRVSRPGWTRS